MKKRITYREFEAYMKWCRWYNCKPTIAGLQAVTHRKAIKKPLPDGNRITAH